MPRAFLIVIDSVGIGGAPDADQFFNGTIPDTGANTLGHIAQACAAGKAEDGRSGPLKIETLAGLGLGHALALASGVEIPALMGDVSGAWGAATEISRGKDTPSGHWEIAGVPVPWDWHTFPDASPAFPTEITRLLCEAAGTPEILGNCHASGTAIIETLGESHVESGFPICYTSADSVLQIAAHEEFFGLEKLYQMCRDAAPTLHEMRVGRVIARPFVGGNAATFQRTENRKDFAIAPPGRTICDDVYAAGYDVHAIGKIGDIFSMRGINDVTKGRDAKLMEDIADRIANAADNSFTFANLVEFDSEYGHRRDTSGYARHLEWFNVKLSEILPRLQHGDLLIITADHGNDPTWVGTDHTRERVPVLMVGPPKQNLGLIGFSDIGATIAAHLDVAYSGKGTAVL